MTFGFSHDELRCLVDGIIGSIPIDDHASYASADHVCDLALDLRRIGRAITDIHVVGLTKPEHKVGIDLRCRSGIEQGMNVVFADVSCP